jgi:hypothetical protein
MAIFHQVPVITTVMEKCKGTFYDLIREYPEPSKHMAWVAQLIFGLAYAQRNYGLTHNDLHGNNVMYVPTDQEYLYYKMNGLTYQVPTYGYIMKIIDFDRAILSLRLVGMKHPRQFMSSQFQPDEEAAGQYNVEPFFLQPILIFNPIPLLIYADLRHLCFGICFLLDPIPNPRILYFNSFNNGCYKVMEHPSCFVKNAITMIDITDFICIKL